MFKKVPRPTKPYYIKVIGDDGTYFVPTPSITSTITPSVGVSLSPTPTNTKTPTPTPTITKTNTPTNTQTPTKTVTPTNTPTLTPTPTTPPLPFISVWRTTTPNETINLPYSPSGTYLGTIDWGDGNISVNNYANDSHTYALPGDYVVTITGTIIGFSFLTTGDKLKIIEILQWGPVRGLGGGNSSMFDGCSNLVLTGVTDTPNLAGITSLFSMFRNCSSLTTINNLNSWDVSSVILMTNVFSFSINFNQNIGSWNVSGVTNMNGMFNSATAFNNGGSSSISGWNVSSVDNMAGMFQNTSFNQDIGSWNVSGVTAMGSMFKNATAFNQDLSGWCVSQIPPTPIDFDTGASSWTGGAATRPQWGTCPP
jgi:surface protein